MNIKITLTALFLNIYFLTAFSQVEKFQAAYLFNFTRFIEWPSEFLSESFVIGVLGNDPVIKELQNAASTKTVYGKKIDILVFNSVENIMPAHIVFVPNNQSEKLGSVAGKIGGQNTLLVSYDTKGIDNGSGINFILLDNKLQFEIKKSNITKYNLKVNSELENLAKKKY
jgi:hypothetical protein